MQQQSTIEESSIKEPVIENEIIEESEIDIDKILKSTLQGREEKEKHKKDLLIQEEHKKYLLTQDMNDAIFHISKNFELKIANDSKKGHIYTIMYTYSDKNKSNSFFDLENKKICFRCSSLDSLRVDDKFINLFKQYVNRNNKNSKKLYVYFRFYYTSANIKMWNICVSWKNIVQETLQDSPRKNYHQANNQKSYVRAKEHQKMDPSEKRSNM